MKRFLQAIPAASVFILAWIVRFVFNITVARNYTSTHDAYFYQLIARNLLTAHCFCIFPPVPTVDRPPLWPATIAAIYGIFGPNEYFVRIFLCFVGAGSCVLIYLCAREIFNEAIGILAGIIAAIYPQLYLYDGWLDAESLYIFLLLAFAYSLLRLQRTGKWSWVIWSGVLLGLLSLERPNGVVVLGLFVVWMLLLLWKMLETRRLKVRRMLLALLIAIVLIAPWTLRNYLLTRTFIPVTTGEGTILIGSYNDAILQSSNPGGWVNPNVADPALGHQYHFADWQGPTVQVARETAFRHFAEHWVLQHTNALPAILKAHFLDMWGPVPTDTDHPLNRFPNERATQLVLFLARYDLFFIYALAAAGFLLTLRNRWRELLFFYLLVLATVAQCLVTYGTPRFRAPIEPVLVILAAGAIWWLTQYFKRLLENREQVEADRAEQPVNEESNVLASDM